jgi:hypothetical protein
MSSDNEMLRSLVREALRDALGGANGASEIAKVLANGAAPTQKPAQVIEMVSFATDAEVKSFVHRILDLAADGKTLSALRSGEIVFQLTDQAKSNVATDSTIRKAAESGSTLILGRKVVVTSLARDKARDLGVSIIRENQQENQKGSVMR